MDLLQKILKLNPRERIIPLHALAHNYFNEIREEKLYNKLTNVNKNILFDFNESKRFLLL
jgi:hypothetical protein